MPEDAEMSLDQTDQERSQKQDQTTDELQSSVKCYKRCPTST